MENETSDTRDGVAFAEGDDVFFIPAGRLDEFKLSGDRAESVRASLGDEGEEGDVSGFAMGGLRPLSFGFRGEVPIANASEWLEWSPPPPPSKFA